MYFRMVVDRSPLHNVNISANEETRTSLEKKLETDSGQVGLVVSANSCDSMFSADVYKWLWTKCLIARLAQCSTTGAANRSVDLKVVPLISWVSVEAYLEAKAVGLLLHSRLFYEVLSSLKIISPGLVSFVYARLVVQKQWLLFWV